MATIRTVLVSKSHSLNSFCLNVKDVIILAVTMTTRSILTIRGWLRLWLQRLEPSARANQAFPGLHTCRR